jgi:hypothetical protein
MSSSDQIKDLIRTGKKVGYILEIDLKKCISHLPKPDQEYIRHTIEGFKIQLITTKKDYDELKYLSGPDAIEFLQNLSDGKYKAFNKDEEESK